MTPERWQQVTGIFHAALARDPNSRGSFVDEACGDDTALRAEVEAMLVAHRDAGRFGEVPVVGALDDPRPGAGSTLGGYRIERVLGRGGMGVVFLAYDTTLRRQVALKVMDGAANGETSRARLLREARNAAALNHPNICTIHEVGDATGSAFIAMEYVEGRSLRDRLDESALPLEEAVRYGIQAADALAYAHERGVIHRDFKAANTIVTEAGRLKVVDFGLARRGDALMVTATTTPTLVPAGAAAGTPYAMAPEQVRGDPADIRTDIWALGVLLYEMVTGAKPFDAPTIPELFSSILRDAPAPIPAAVPIEMCAVIERCLSRDPERRYQHSGEVRAALEAIQAGTTAPWAAWRYRVRRRRWLAFATGLIGIAAVLVGFNVSGVRDRIRGGPPETALIKLAVLPFENLTGDPEQEYFSDGLTEEMITQLGRLHPQRLSVIARTSSMRYKDRDTPIDQIGRELGVDYVLEGSARREGSRVRISATLIQVRDQAQRWTDSFDRELAGILSLQSDVARGVAGSLALTLLPAEQTRLSNIRPVNPETYEAYLRGLSHVEKLTRADLDAALQYFESALERDPAYALAYVGIGFVWSGRQQMGFVAPNEARPRMKAALAKAFELDDTLPEAHFQLALQSTWTDWDFAAAESHFQRAIDLNPNHAQARAYYSHYLMILRRPDEAMSQMQRAVELDPLNPLIQSLHGGALLMVRRFDEALAQYRNVLRTAPASPLALGGVANALDNLERYEEALAAERTLWTARGNREVADALVGAYAETGYRGAMRRAADAFAAQSNARNTNPMGVARMYLRARQSDRALEWLERSYEARDPGLPYISSGHKDFDAVRTDPRFQDLLRRMNLPR